MISVYILSTLLIQDGLVYPGNTYRTSGEKECILLMNDLTEDYKKDKFAVYGDDIVSGYDIARTLTNAHHDILALQCTNLK